MKDEKWNTFIAEMTEDGMIKVVAGYKYGIVLKNAGASWNFSGYWTLPLTISSLECLRGVRGAKIDAKIVEKLGADVEPAADPIPEDLEGIIARMPVKVKPYAHQAAAFKRAMEVFE